MKREILKDKPSDLLFTVNNGNKILGGLMSEFPEFQAGNIANICENGKVYFETKVKDETSKEEITKYILYDPLQKEELSINNININIESANPTIHNASYENIKNILIKNPVNYRRILFDTNTENIKFNMKFGNKFKLEISNLYKKNEQYIPSIYNGCYDGTLEFTSNSKKDIPLSDSDTDNKYYITKDDKKNGIREVFL